VSASRSIAQRSRVHAAPNTSAGAHARELVKRPQY
jgi:hypothetical protein